MLGALVFCPGLDLLALLRGLELLILLRSNLDVVYPLDAVECVADPVGVLLCNRNDGICPLIDGYPRQLGKLLNEVLLGKSMREIQCGFVLLPRLTRLTDLLLYGCAHLRMLERFR